ncbi:hypothetical protein [Bosea vaviloviae]|uniref:hypothetical protein n=1 Tax=Bosea vaviloviae TaxID=1526658 RepID=UPI0018D11572|nr:hypothetical protein [Bosea vaviloviae]
MAIARDVARAQKQADAMRLRAAREQDRDFRANLREMAREERENLRSLKEQARDEKLQYLEHRQEEAESLSAEAQQRLDELNGVLGFTLLVNDRIDFDALRISDTVEPFKASGSVRVAEIRPLEKDYLANANVPTGWRKLLPGTEKKRIQALADAKQRFDQADASWQKREEDRIERLEADKRAHGNKVAALEAKKSTRNSEVDSFKAEYDTGDPTAIVAYCTMVLERSQYPEYFPQKFRWRLRKRRS